jgi:hypothetical protein
MKTYILTSNLVHTFNNVNSDIVQITNSNIIFVTNFIHEIINYVEKLDNVETEEFDEPYYDLLVWENGVETHCNYIDIPFQCSIESFVENL